MSIITYPLNGITYDASDAETYLCTRESGVFATDQFVASVTGARQITVGPGIAWVKNGNYSPANLYKNGMIEGSPFNIDSTDFIGVFSTEEGEE